MGEGGDGDDEDDEEERREESSGEDESGEEEEEDRDEEVVVVVVVEMSVGVGILCVDVSDECVEVNRWEMPSHMTPMRMKIESRVYKGLCFNC